MKKLAVFLWMLFPALFISCTGNEEPKTVAEPHTLPAKQQVADNLGRSVASQPMAEKKKLHTAAALAGTWVHEKDSLAYVTIENTTWISGYENEVLSRHDLAIVNKLPYPFESQDETQYIILTNPEDTVYYSIEGLSKEYLNLMWLPAGHLHSYKRIR